MGKMRGAEMDQFKVQNFEFSILNFALPLPHLPHPLIFLPLSVAIFAADKAVGNGFGLNCGKNGVT
jgi:hypothetical protein